MAGTELVVDAAPGAGVGVVGTGVAPGADVVGPVGTGPAGAGEVDVGEMALGDVTAADEPGGRSVATVVVGAGSPPEELQAVSRTASIQAAGTARRVERFTAVVPAAFEPAAVPRRPVPAPTLPSLRRTVNRFRCPGKER